MGQERIKWENGLEVEAQFLGTNINNNARSSRVYYANGVLYKTGTDRVIFDEMEVLSFLNTDPHETDETHPNGDVLYTNVLEEFSELELTEQLDDSDFVEDVDVDDTEGEYETADIYHIINPTYLPGDTGPYHHVASIPATSLSEAWRMAQNFDDQDDWSAQGFRSTTVNDVIGFKGKKYRINGSEFVLLEEREE